MKIWDCIVYIALHFLKSTSVLMCLPHNMNSIKINSKIFRAQSSENTKELYLNYSSNRCKLDFEVSKKGGQQFAAMVAIGSAK